MLDYLCQVVGFHFHFIFIQLLVILKSLSRPSPEKRPLHTLASHHLTSHTIQLSDQSLYSMENALRQAICPQIIMSHYSL